MNEVIGSGSGSGSGRQPYVRAAVAAAVAGITALAAACAGGTAPPTGQTPYQQALSYAQCLRSHGDPGFPDPNSQGLFPHPAGPQYQSAISACGHLLPAQPTTASQRAAQVSQALRFSACMRSHGVTDFPDPTVVPGGKAVMMGPARGTDQNSPQFEAAVHACRQLEPGLAGQMTSGGTP